jgi:molybdopterin-guanine dinucleotide biosynthesis protein A
MHSTPDICGLILAGGAGRRVGGRDKGLIDWQGKPLVTHVIQRLAPQVEQLLVSCNRNTDTYRAFNLSLVGDHRSEFQGPLAGIEAVGELIETEFLLIAPCDTPCLPTDLAARLLHPMLSTGGDQLDVSYAHDGEREQYLCAILRKRILGGAGAYLDSGQRSVRGWYAQLQTAPVDFSDQSTAFENFNVLE